MKCQRCGHLCVAAISADCWKNFGIKWPGSDRVQKGKVLPHELIGLREGGVPSNFLNFHYCLMCGQIQGEWPVKGADKYLREFAEKRVWQALFIGGEGTWTAEYYLAKTIEEVLAVTRGPMDVIVRSCDEPPEDVEVKELVSS